MFNPLSAAGGTGGFFYGVGGYPGVLFCSIGCPSCRRLSGKLRGAGVRRQSIAGQTYSNTYQQDCHYRFVRFFVIDFVHRYLPELLIKWQPGAGFRNPTGFINMKETVWINKSII